MPIVVDNAEDYKFLCGADVWAIYPAQMKCDPLEIALMNLTPADRKSEIRVMKLISSFPLPVKITVFDPSCFAARAGGKPNVLRLPFNLAEKMYFNGLVVTGEPDCAAFNRYTYWKEFADISDWTKSNVSSTMFTGWSAQAALYRFYNIKKSNLKDVCRGIFENIRIPDAVSEPLMRGISDSFFMPHCHRSIVYARDILNVGELKVLAYSKRAGATVIKSADGRRVFVTGHMDYDRFTLREMYLNEAGKNPYVKPPANYFADKDFKDVNMSWASASALFYLNWLNFCVYNTKNYAVTELKAAAAD